MTIHREGEPITKIESKALMALVAWHRNWKRTTGNEPNLNDGFDKYDIRLFKLAGTVSKVYELAAKLRTVPRRESGR